jgi:hypothetical protein
MMFVPDASAISLRAAEKKPRKSDRVRAAAAVAKPKRVVRRAKEI